MSFLPNLQSLARSSATLPSADCHHYIQMHPNPGDSPAPTPFAAAAPSNTPKNYKYALSVGFKCIQLHMNVPPNFIS